MTIPHLLRSLAASLPLALPALLSGALPAQLTPGNLAVVRVGDGVAGLSNASQAVFLDELTTAGLPVQTLALPTAASGANQPLTNSGSATSEGILTASVDGRYLVCGGYGTAPGLASVASSASITVNRVIARIGLDGTIDTSTSLTDTFSGNNIRSATSFDGTQFWAAGANGGVRHAALGATTSIAINSVAPTNTRVVNVSDGQLYVTSASGAFQGVSAVGTGIPTSGGQTVTLLPGFPSASGPSNYDFFFADAATVYVADDRASTLGGIQKWTLVAGTWTLQYTLNPVSGGLNVGCRGLTGVVVGGMATLYATTTQTTANEVVTVTDTGPAATFTTLSTAPVNTIYRGLRRVPDPRGSIVRFPHACGTATIAVAGAPILGGSIVTTLGGTTGLPFIGLGFGIVNTPFCTCTVGHDWGAVLFGTTSTLNVPNSAIYLGASVGIQGADLFGAGGCPSPSIAFTDTIVVTIG